MPHAPARLLVLAAVVCGALATPASAARICVPDASPGQCDSTRPTIQAAVDAAASGDTIKIAAGRYEEAVDAGARTLHFIGAGADATLIAPPGGHATPVPALSMPRGGSVRSLRAGAADSYFGHAENGIGIVFEPDVEGSFHLSLAGVVAVGAIGDQGGAPALRIAATAPRLAGASIDDTTVRGGQGGFAQPAVAVHVQGSGASMTADRSLLAGGLGRYGATAGLYVEGGVATLFRSEVSGGAGVSGGSVTATRSSLLGNAAGVSVTAGAVSVTDSVVTARPVMRLADYESAAAFVTGSDSRTASLTARGTTFFAAGSDPDAGVLVRRSAETNQPVSVDLRNSVVRLEGAADATDAELVADRAPITAGFSAFTTVRAVNGGTVPEPAVSGDPRFADAAAGDFTLLPDSPLVDRGDPGIVAPGQLDRAGNPRSTDGNGDCVAAPDIGAFERPEACGRPRVSAFSIADRRFAPVARRRTARRRHVKHGTRFRYTLSEPASLSIAILRLPSGRRAGVLRAREREGKQWRRFNGRLDRRALRPGRYRARIVATDLQGARSRARQLTFRIVRP